MLGMSSEISASTPYTNDNSDGRMMHAVRTRIGESGEHDIPAISVAGNTTR
jgi:hypothetical protein